ncbi:MAG: hypothetical protein ACM31P_11500, partial [Actinomycetota bacterium]
MALLGGLIVALAVPAVFAALGYQGEVARLEAALQGSQAEARQHLATAAAPRPPKEIVDSLAWL